MSYCPTAPILFLLEHLERNLGSNKVNGEIGGTRISPFVFALFKGHSTFLQRLAPLIA